MPVTMQQSAKPFVIQVESEDDVFSSIHETVHIDEQTSTVSDLVTASAKELICNAYPNESKMEPSCAGIPSSAQDLNKPNSSQSNDSFHDEDEENLQQVLNRIYESIKSHSWKENRRNSKTMQQ